MHDFTWKNMTCLDILLLSIISTSDIIESKKWNTSLQKSHKVKLKLQLAFRKSLMQIRCLILI